MSLSLFIFTENKIKMKNKSIEKINLQAFQLSATKQFTDAGLANLSDRYAGIRVSPTAFYTAYFNMVPNIIYLEAIDFEKGQKWLLNKLETEIKDVFFTKKWLRKKKKLSYHTIYYLLYDDLLLYADKQTVDIMLLFRQTPLEKIDRLVAGLQKFRI